MSCISPIAPLGETVRTSLALSTRMSARIQATGMPKRREASATTLANGALASAGTGGTV